MNRIARAWKGLASEQDGMALPTALLATVAAMALGGAAVLSTVGVQQGSHRDSGSKSAIGAADAGANVALLRLKRDSAELGEASCLSGATPEGNGWCSPVGGEVGEAEYEYRMSEAGAGCGEYAYCVVATGTAGGVTRRVLVSFDEASETPGGGSGSGSGEESGVDSENENSEGLIGVDEIEIDNEADARVSIGTNGNVHVYNNGNVCGNVRHGVGKTATFENNGTQCDGYEVTEGDVSVPSVASFMPSNIATSNSNYRLVKCTGTNTPTGCQSDTYTRKWSSTVPWDPSTREISAWNNQSLTLGGGDYFVCRLELSNNSHLIMAAGAQVRIFFDTPESCGISEGENQIFVANNANITSTGYGSTPDNYEMPGLFLTGSTTISTQVEWKNNSGTNEFVLYAPNTDVVLQNNTEFVGMIVGKTVHLVNNAIVRQDSGFQVPPTLNPWSNQTTEGEPDESEPPPGPPTYTAQYYVECSGPASPSPDSGC
jgi:hypothetical protein